MCPEHESETKKPWFTVLSETTSISNLFWCGSPPWPPKIQITISCPKLAYLSIRLGFSAWLKIISNKDLIYQLMIIIYFKLQICLQQKKINKNNFFLTTLIYCLYRMLMVLILSSSNEMGFTLFVRQSSIFHQLLQLKCWRGTVLIVKNKYS